MNAHNQTQSHIPTKAALWAAQLEEYPESVELSEQDMARWAFSADTQEEKTRRYAALGRCMQYSSRVFYKTHNSQKACIGCRYGVKPWEYASSFTLDIG